MMLNLPMLVSAAATLFALGQSMPSERTHMGKWRIPRSDADAADVFFERIVTNFKLDAATQKWLRAELDRRLAASVDYNRVKSEIVAEGSVARKDQVKFDAVMTRLGEHEKKRPLRLESVVEALKSHMPLAPWQAGKARLDEEGRQMAEYRMREIAEEKRKMREEAEASFLLARATPPTEPARHKAPLLGKAATRPAPEQPSSSSRKTDGVSHSAAATRDSSVPSVAAQTQPAAGRGATAEWERMVHEASERYKFTDRQSQMARSILHDCERRAESYRKAQAGEYERINHNPDVKQRDSDKASLDAPLIALGQELRERLEQLSRTSR